MHLSIPQCPDGAERNVSCQQSLYATQIIRNIKIRYHMPIGMARRENHMPQVHLAPDTLDEENQRFVQQPLTKPVFLNSIPKSGSHLLRNILRMFVPVNQQYKDDFIQWPNISKHMAAFDPKNNFLVSAHLLYSDKSAILANRTNKVLLVRDPYTWVMAQARFLVSEQVTSNFEHIKDGTLTVDDLLSLMIVGIYQRSPPMRDQYNMFAVAWMGTDAHIVRYEDLVAHVSDPDTPEAESYFASLLRACGILMPSDWRQRVAIGADRKQSGTAREKLDIKEPKFAFPEVLSEQHKRMVEYHAPGLRTFLGYHD